MTLDYRVVPLTDPDSIEGDGRWSPFDASWSDTKSLLERELAQFHETDVCLGLDVFMGQLTNDGKLRARSKAASRAVRISFETPDGPMDFATAMFTAKTGSWLPSAYMREDWQHNVRAIALGMEALRKVDRYGIGQGKQYAGYKALGPGTGGIAMGGMTRSEAIAVLAEIRNIPVDHFNTDPESLAHSYKRARRLTHPDHNGGDQSDWDRVEQAAKVLGISR